MNSDKDMLLAGASNTGFTDPAQGTAISLLQVTTLLLVRDPTVDSLSWMYVLQQMAKDVGEAFLLKQTKQDDLDQKFNARPN